MNAQLDLKNTEKAGFKLASYADGTTDIGLGLTMILMGFYPLTRAALGPGLNILVILAGLGLIVGLQVYLKSRLAPSRIGVVKFGAKVSNRKKAAIVITAALVVLTGLTWYASVKGISLPHPAWAGQYGLDLVFAAVILAVFSALAYSFQVARLYLYGALLAVAFLDLIPASLVGLEMQLSLALVGVLIAVAGVFILAGFLKRYPAANEED